MKLITQKIITLSNVVCAIVIGMGFGWTQTTFNYTGTIQTYTVPVGVTTINISAAGAQGGGENGGGGMGAIMSGDFSVTPGQVLNVIVGQMGQLQIGGNYQNSSGGGGGSFVYDQVNTLFVAAGGGGGKCNYTGSPALHADAHGKVTPDGGANTYGQYLGGVGGNGGSAGLWSSSPCSGGGTGWLTAGGGPYGGLGLAGNWTGGTPFCTGGGGGCAGYGGYGGGGGGGNLYGGGGGGGGFSGGGGGTDPDHGGGGGSFSIGTNQSNIPAVQTGNGVVIITALCSATTLTADVATLADVISECSATPVAPSATNDCGVQVYGTPDVSFPINAQGTTIVTWTYDDGVNQITQTQNVINTDVTAPVADNGALPDLTDQCGLTPSAPTATDNCSGTIVATADVIFPISTPGASVITWTYDDGNGNTTTQTQNVMNAAIDITVTLNGAQLESNQLASTYQWLDCDNGFAQVNGAINQMFTPTVTGNYAVEITSVDGCVDTSACYLVDFTGINEMLSPKKKEVINIIDVMGRKTEFRPNTPLIYIYSDGSMERVFKLEE